VTDEPPLMLGRAAAAASILLLVASASPIAAADGSYFPLRAGNWWSYEELDDDGRPLSRETWTVLDATPADRTGEFHLRSFTKRLDMLGHMGRRWEGHEFLRTTDLGLHKRYPASGRDKEFEVTLLREPVAAGTRWHDAQGDCEVISLGGCTGPRGELPDCAIIACRLGRPTATVVTSTYARGIGMVRQELDVVQFVAGFHAAGPVPLPCDGAKGGHSTLRLTAFHVAAR
jgi:hypothetical protein